jgi:NADH-quinone oxidoreductase subunit F
MTLFALNVSARSIRRRSRAIASSGGFDALRRAIEIGPDAVIKEVIDFEAHGPRRRRVPHRPKVGRRRQTGRAPHYLICNADESSPARSRIAFSSRAIRSRSSKSMTIAGFATGASAPSYIYAANTRSGPSASSTRSIESRAHGFLGDDILGRGIEFDIEIAADRARTSAGKRPRSSTRSKGYRGEPRNKPPFPVQAGCSVCRRWSTTSRRLRTFRRSCSTAVPQFAEDRHEQSTGTKLFCVSGNVVNPGVFEVPFGVTIRHVLDLAGGIANGRSLQTILLGARRACSSDPNDLDMPLTFEGARAAKRRSARRDRRVRRHDRHVADPAPDRVVFPRRVVRQCVPCRVGTVRQEEALYRIASKRRSAAYPMRLRCSTKSASR